MQNTFIICIIGIFFFSSCENAKTSEVREVENIGASQQSIQVEKQSEIVVFESHEQQAALGEEGKVGLEKIYSKYSLPALIEKDIVGIDLILEEVLADNSIYTRYRVSYLSGDLKVSGIMNIPKGEGPYPLLILAHGYIDISVYTNGRGLKREQDYFARNGYAVFHPDYRNHAFSDTVSEDPYDFRIGYTQDVIASILASKNTNIPEFQSINTDKIGLLGHSMGGGIAQNISVVAPELVDAIVLYAPVSNNEYLNFERFQMSNPRRIPRVEQVLQEYGDYQENPFFWSHISSQNFIENITTPVQVYSGTNDIDTPTEWSENIVLDLQDAGKNAELIQYEGERHEFITRWPDFMQGSKNFFDTHLQ